MKQEEEPWIDHLKQRVNEYEKPSPKMIGIIFKRNISPPIYIRKKG